MDYAETVLDLIGHTPLVRLNKVTEGVEATVLAKIEYLNPGGSSKDRIAVRIIEAAEREGKLKPGGTIVEPTSGNTGIGLALVAQQRGYRCVFVCPDKVSEDKRNTLIAYGAEVVVCPTAVAPDSPESYYSVSDRLAREIPGAFKPDSTPTRTGRSATTRPPARRSGSRPRGASRISSRASEPGAPSAVSASTSKSATLISRWSESIRSDRYIHTISRQASWARRIATKSRASASTFCPRQWILGWSTT